MIMITYVPSLNPMNNEINNARVAKSADAGDLKSPSRKGVWVQVPLRAPSNNTLTCMTNAIYFESRGESLLGKIAVGHVILNRSKRRKLSVCEVVNEPGQFSWKTNPKPIKNKKLWDEIYKISYKVIMNEYKDPTNGSTFFHSIKVNPKWISNKSLTVLIGNHKFYKINPVNNI